jgi:tetratricopeptide (TPR) repeat protein
MKRIFAFVFIGSIAILLVIKSVSLKNTLLENIFRVRVFKAWEAVSIKENLAGIPLSDGIPDSWSPCSWGNARGYYEIEDQEVFSGKQALRVNQTNEEGVICLYQTIEIPGNVDLFVKVYSKGEGGEVQTRLHDHITKEWIDYGYKNWIRIKPSVEWKQYQFSFEIPSNIDQVELRLRGENIYDEAYLGIINDDGEVEQNLLDNPGFEKDGLNQEPLVWWNDNMISTIDDENFDDVTFSSLGYINIIDLLESSYATIQERGRIIGTDCVLTPEMTGFLISKGLNDKLPGGLSVSERIFQLAIDLFPNCPQPYAALAELYSSQHSYLLAAGLYHQATELAGTTPLAGKYSFEEGFIHIRHTGLIDMAIPALENAETFKGWERSGWHQGAASLFLGTAYEYNGMLEEAIIAYQRVLKCSACSEHHESAKTRLNILRDIEPRQ